MSAAQRSAVSGLLVASLQSLTAAKCLPRKPMGSAHPNEWNAGVSEGLRCALGTDESPATRCQTKQTSSAICDVFCEVRAWPCPFWTHLHLPHRGVDAVDRPPIITRYLLQPNLSLSQANVSVSTPSTSGCSIVQPRRMTRGRPRRSTRKQRRAEIENPDFGDRFRWSSAAPN